jgi:thioesterase domain-containing protein
VGLLALIDQGPILPFTRPVDDAEYLVNTFGQNVSLPIEQLRQMTRDEQIAFVWDKARKARWLFPDVTLDQFRNFVTMLRTHTEAWRDYAIGPYGGQVTLFRAEKPSEHTPPEADFGWGAYAHGGVTVIDVPGDHLSMMHEPDIKVLANHLQRCLDEVAQPQGVV